MDLRILVRNRVKENEGLPFECMSFKVEGFYACEMELQVSHRRYYLLWVKIELRSCYSNMERPLTGNNLLFPNYVCQCLASFFFRKSNWLRCVAVHEEGRRIAICQTNNYIRVYNIGRSQKTPLTLKHPLQSNVASMAWE